jgi:hypothetical protein
MTTTENYYYTKGALDYRDQLLEALSQMRSVPETEFALRFVRSTFPKEVEPRVVLN